VENPLNLEKNEIIRRRRNHKWKEEEGSNKSKTKEVTLPTAIFSNSDGWWAGRPTAGHRQG
jgi:hypothetical protein